MKTIKCERCRGTGYVPYKHIKNGICFDCDGKKEIQINLKDYNVKSENENRYAGIYILVVNGEIEEVIESNSFIPPVQIKGESLIYEVFNIDGNEIMYRKKWNSFTKKSEIFSASFIHINKLNTIDVLERLKISKLKNEIALFEIFDTIEAKKEIEKRHELIKRARKDIINQLSSLNL